MASELTHLQPLELTSIRDDVEAPKERASARTLPGIVLAVVALAGAVWAVLVDTATRVGPGRVLCAVVVVAWALAAAFVARQRPAAPLGVLMGAGAVCGAIALVGAVELAHGGLSSSSRDVAFAARAFGLALAIGVAIHAALALPDGRLALTGRRVGAGIGYVAALAAAVIVFADRPDFSVWPYVALGAVGAVLAVPAFVNRCQRATVAQRPRLQWTVWGSLVTVAIALAAAVLAALVDWPDSVLAVSVTGTIAVPLSLSLGAIPRQPIRIDRVLVNTIVLVGLVALVGACYLLVVLGLGRRPAGDEQTLLGLSILAAAIAALAWVPARERLTDLATRRVYGERHAPDEVLRTFGSRLTRALPLDELLLQLAESLKKTMNLDVAEVWTRGAGRLERAVSVPERGPAKLELGAEDEQVVARAGVSGPAWARVWVPSLVAGTAGSVMRVAPVTNSGELLGLIVVRRPSGAI